MKSPPVGRVAGADDVPGIAACLTSAFYDDLVWGRWMFPDEASRPERLYELMHFWALAAVKHAWVWMTEHAQAVAVWLPPGEPEMTIEQEEEFGSLVINLLGPRADEVNALFDRFAARHPMKPHYYLSLWATHRNHAGLGLGTALIHENLARIDEERMPAYLESTNPANRARYERLGFRWRGEFGVAGGPLITTMWREAC